MCIGIYICVARGSVMSLAFSGAGFFTKSMGMVAIMFLGIDTFGLDFKIFIPLLSLFFLITHFAEAMRKVHEDKKNGRLTLNQHGVETANKYSWKNAALKMKSKIYGDK